MMGALSELAVLPGEAQGVAVVEVQRVSRGGEIIRRGKVAGACCCRRVVSPWVDLYFCSHPTYSGNVFRERFGVPRSLYLN